jgi:catechol 2,3-dioxygenase-like lactoylglutathione lyase family enzyme
MPILTGVIETALYVDDLQRASKFYEKILGLRRIGGDEERLHAYSVADRGVLLLFKHGATAHPIQTPNGLIPPHDGNGQNHFALGIPTAELAAWEKQLAGHAIEIESRVHWPLGGTSIYFRDPDGNLVELATPGMWPIY